MGEAYIIFQACLKIEKLLIGFKLGLNMHVIGTTTTTGVFCSNSEIIFAKFQNC